MLGVLVNIVEETKSLLRNSRTGIPSPRSVQVQTIPTGTTARGAISCFVAFAATMTVHVLHGEPDPTVNVKHLTLGVGFELHKAFRLDGAKMNTLARIQSKQEQIHDDGF